MDLLIDDLKILLWWRDMPIYRFIIHLMFQQSVANINEVDNHAGLMKLWLQSFYTKPYKSIILVIRQMQDIRMGQIGKGILRSLGQITRNQIICGDFSYFTEGGREKHHSKGQKYQRRQSCNASDISKLLKNYSISTQKTNKSNLDKENLYYYDIPVPPKYKRKSSCKPSRNEIQISRNYSQIQSCLDINEPIKIAISGKAKQANSFSSTCCSGKSGSKRGFKSSKDKTLQEMLMRSSFLLGEYQNKCKHLQKENGQIRQKYAALNKKIKRLSKGRPNDIINVF